MKRTRMRRKPPRDRAVWIAARDRVLTEEPRCLGCGGQSVVVHHIRNQGMGFRDHSRGNLMALCEACHREAHRDPQAWRARFAPDEVVERPCG